MIPLIVARNVYGVERRASTCLVIIVSAIALAVLRGRSSDVDDPDLSEKFLAHRQRVREQLLRRLERQIAEQSGDKPAER